jgi:hypothetical protein
MIGVAMLLLLLIYAATVASARERDSHRGCALLATVGSVILFTGMAVAIGFGNAFSGWGDGATVRHTTSEFLLWPPLVFDAVLIAGLLPVSSRALRGTFTPCALLLFVSLAVLTDLESAVVIGLVTLAFAGPIWLLAVRAKDRSAGPVVRSSERTSFGGE